MAELQLFRLNTSLEEVSNHKNDSSNFRLTHIDVIAKNSSHALQLILKHKNQIFKEHQEELVKDGLEEDTLTSLEDYFGYSTTVVSEWFLEDYGKQFVADKCISVIPFIEGVINTNYEGE